MKENTKKQDLLDYYDLWKYCNDIGDKDKDRMITIVTWHLGTVVLIIGYITTKLIDIRAEAAIILTCLSVLICLVSIYWIYAYASYANRYWEIADRCEKHIDGLREFTDKKVFLNSLKNTRPCNIFGYIDQSAMRYLLKTSHEPEKGLLPPFRMLLIIAMLMMLVSVVVCILHFAIRLFLCLSLM